MKLVRLVLAVLRLWRNWPEAEAREPRIVAEGKPDRRAELAVLGLLAAASICGVAFIAVYALDRLPRQTQLLGLSLGLTFVFVAAALIVVGRRLVPYEELEEHYPEPAHPEEQEDVVRIVDESGSRFTRKRLLKLAAAGTGGVVATALVTPAVSLGPVFDTDRLYRTPWHRGRRLVDEAGRPYLAAAIETDTFYTAYPEDAPRDDLAAPLVVVRLDPGKLRLPAGRDGWAPRGILAYSKTCTHAACAIALYRTPLFEPTSPRPALVCPCHYSTFDPATGGTVLFGPAGRPLPQLPLAIDDAGHLRAGGGFSGPIGPSWWGVRERKRV
ncbi:MAG TPA: Rieske 2Fe-2S domain-containing protein [Gaiellaceae bacterium]|nr:Rieske 2Fe-2S domain-containing protein [Gaiellaceae bacterium]